MRLISQLVLSALFLVSLDTIALANTPTNQNDSNNQLHPYQFFTGFSIEAAYSNLKANELTQRVNNPALGAIGNQITSIDYGSPIVYNFELGYMTSPHFGIDFGYIYKPHKIGMTVQNDFSHVQGNAELTLKTYTAGLIADFPIQPKLSFIGKFGIALVQSYLDFDTKAQSITHVVSENATQPTPMISLGLAYYLTSNLALTATYMHIFEIRNIQQIDTAAYGTINSGVMNPALNDFGAGLRYYF